MQPPERGGGKENKMGKLQEFHITLNDNKVVYSPGESISGTVKISTAQPIQCKGKTSYF